MKATIRLLVAMGILLNVSDIVTTMYAVTEMGATEANPFVAPFIMETWFWVLKALVGTGIFLFLGQAALGRRPALWALRIGVIIYTVVVANNLLGIILGKLGLY